MMKTRFLLDESGKNVLLQYSRDALGIPHYIRIKRDLLNNEKNVEIVRDFFKNNFFLYLELKDIQNAFNRGGFFEPWLFEEPNKYQNVVIDEL